MDYLVMLVLIGIALICFFVQGYKKKKYGFVDELSEYDVQRRKCESPIESRLFNSLYRNDYPVVTQYPVGKYRLDMAIVGLKIAIEADGKAYHSSPAQKAHDRKRDRYLRSKGWKVLRFSGSQIHRNVNGVIQRIDKEVLLRSQKPI